MTEAKTLANIGLWFVAGAVITLAFSASLYSFYPYKSFERVILEGMLIPSFTWTVQCLSALSIKDKEKRFSYWLSLGKVCVIGSFALLPAATYNLFSNQPSGWVSIVNTVLSVALMFICHLRLMEKTSISKGWSFFWLATIGTNMCLYYLFGILS